MKKSTRNLTCDNDYFSARLEGGVVVFSPKGNVLLRSTILKAKEQVLDYFEAVSASSEARVLLLVPRARKSRREEYLSFIDMVKSGRMSENSVMRLYRAVDQIILHIRASSLFFISADCGQILPMAANISLACDYRILGDNACFQNPALELGLIAKGGGAWFLSRLLGRSKALELLLARQSLTPDEARAMGLVDRLVPADDFEAESLRIASRFAGIPATSLRLAKRLVSHCESDLAEYLEMENHELVRALYQTHIR
ncbi:hypothetical protein DSCA_16170 [Desulfosarcina alkanivorans]|uniref:Enoyl-CoA hydratase n=1 Tax=Desulfosarcina alkanivorans TaxID=571177 RepID=A0A5K7YSS1_9BACT|nr:enoyl-CoA hydratase/isomerase family protein [Desulfosarcina alkanivorans]BBO67687.1 hypothetical protein DSCA_16170 [Desulfosarcina alkanivorans]